MNLSKLHFYSLIIFSVMVAFCSSGKLSSGMGDKPADRPMWAAGRFYPGDSLKLSKALQQLYDKAEARKSENVLAIISPHAAYVYSGEVAASAFNQVDYDRNYQHVFFIASSHRAYFDGASVYNLGDYLTPLGRVKVDTSLANRIIRDNPLMGFNTAYHADEHSLEVQLPFFQYRMKNDYSIIPIIVGTDNPKTCKKIANALRPYFNSDNLFIISTDFSHYPSYSDAIVVDRRTSEAIASNSPEALLETLGRNAREGYASLSTSLCGYTSVLSLLYMSETTPGIHIRPVIYKNSGDAGIGDKDRVVGYCAIAFEGEKTKPIENDVLSEKDKRDLLELARMTLEIYVKEKNTYVPFTTDYSPALMKEMGAFVTLRKNASLRGCIGRFTPEEPLWEVVRQMTVSAAVSDYRFSPVTKDELPQIHIEISVLTPLKKISTIDEIVMGKHGIYIKKGIYSGTYLPQVARETGWSREEFLSHCASDKAGLGTDGWKDADIYIYEAIVFEEERKQ